MIPPLFFDHLLKVAGTSLCSVLSRALGPEAYVRVDGLRCDTAFASARRATLLAGHIQHVPGFIPSTERFTFTLLRHPVARTISAYHHLRKRPESDQSPAAVAARQQSLVDFVLSGRLGTEIVHNYQARHFATILPPNECAPVLERAKTVLGQHYHLVGVQEQFDPFLAKLGFILGLEVPIEAGRENRATPVGDNKKLDPSVVRLIEECNGEDIALWEWAEALAAEHVRSNYRVAVIQAAGATRAAQYRVRRVFNGPVEFLGAKIGDSRMLRPAFASGDRSSIEVRLISPIEIKDLTVGFSILDTRRQTVFATNTRHLGFPIRLEAGKPAAVKLEIPLDLGPGEYVGGVTCHLDRDEYAGLFFWVDEAFWFEVTNPNRPEFCGTSFLPVRPSLGSISEMAPFMPKLPNNRIPVSLECSLQERSVTGGAECTIPVRITNKSQFSLGSLPPFPIFLSYHLFAGDGNIVTFDGLRTEIPEEIRPEQWADIALRIEAPRALGVYRLQISLVQEGVFWFENPEVPSPFVALRVDR